MDNTELFQREQEYIRSIREMHPELLQVPEGAPHVFSHIGIPVPTKPKLEGYLKYSALDFVVEEIDDKEKLVAVDSPKEPAPEGVGAETTIVGADLIKVGIGTNDAIARVAELLQIPPERVAYAGMKDEVAVTAQRITIEGFTPETLPQVEDSRFFLRNVRTKTKTKRIGNLTGNRFTILVRTPPGSDHTFLADTLRKIERDGFVNYYGIQRFRAPRLLSHVFGAMVMRGEPELAIKAFLTRPSPFETRLWSNVRARMLEHWGDWDAMLKDTESLPGSFRFERTALEALREGGEKPFERAVEALGPIAKLWCVSYTSYIANCYLAEAETKGIKPPREIPLLLTEDLEPDLFWKSYLEQHGTQNWRTHIKPYTFLRLGKNPTLWTRVRPKIHGWKSLPQGVAFSFDLRKGAYATTFLESLFTILPSSPVPEWLDATLCDTKELLGIGSLSSVKTRFAPILASLRSEGNESEEPKE